MTNSGLEKFAVLVDEMLFVGCIHFAYLRNNFLINGNVKQFKSLRDYVQKTNLQANYSPSRLVVDGSNHCLA